MAVLEQCTADIKAVEVADIKTVPYHQILKRVVIILHLGIHSTHRDQYVAFRKPHLR